MGFDGPAWKVCLCIRVRVTPETQGRVCQCYKYHFDERKQFDPNPPKKAPLPLVLSSSAARSFLPLPPLPPFPLSSLCRTIPARRSCTSLDTTTRCAGCAGRGGGSSPRPSSTSTASSWRLRTRRGPPHQHHCREPGRRTRCARFFEAGGEFIARPLCCIFIVCLLVAFQTDWIRKFEPFLDYLSPARSVCTRAHTF